VRFWPSRWPANQVEHVRSASDALSGSLGEPVQPSGTVSGSASEAALKHSHDNKCFYLAAGWWMYELCIGHHVRQFHVSSSKSLEQISTLGETSFYLGTSRYSILTPVHAGQARTWHT